MKKIKAESKAARDFAFFSETPLDMVGHEIGDKPVADPDGASALQCWYSKDTHGKTIPCCEPELLAKAFRGKASWNLQIKLWAEDVANGLLPKAELTEYCTGLPPWIYEATMNQAGKLCKLTVGYIPTYCRL